MKSLYAACLSRLGLSQTEAAALHGVDLSTVKHWSSGRRRVPEGCWDDLRAVEARIVDAGEQYHEAWEQAGSASTIDIDDSEAGGLALMALADFVLGVDAEIRIGQSAATLVARQARRPN